MRSSRGQRILYPSREMPFADIREYCKVNNIPLTAVKCNPSYDEKKCRVSKGSSMCHKGWKDKGRFEYNKTTTSPDDTPSTMWMMSLKKAGMYVIDIDVKGNKKAKDVLDDIMYNTLYNSSNYVIETGSGGLHFYFKLEEGFSGRIQNYTNIDADKAMFKDGEEGSIDVIMDAIITEGSSYSFEGKVYKYVSVKPGDGINTTSTWDRFPDFYNTFLHKQDKKISSSSSDIEYNEVVEHLENIPNNCRDWEAWYRMAQTIFNLLGNDGYEVFRGWSSKNVYHNEREAQQLWRGLSERTDNDKKRGIGSLLYLSKVSNEKQYNIIRKKYNPLSYESLKDLLEQNHFFIEEPKPMYVRISGTVLIQYAPSTFRDLLMSWNYVIEEDGKKKEMSFYNTWIKDSTKKTYKKIGYYPNASECPEDEFNGFFPCRASMLPPNVEAIDISLILNHISIMANHHKESKEFIIKGLAQMVQEPGVMRGICLLFYAKEGAGKDILFNLFGLKVLGEHQYLFAGSIENLFKNFNSELNGKILIHADELVKLDKKNVENLKRLITAGKCRVEKKGVDATTEKWFGRIVGTTNNNDAMSVSLTDRRFGIFHSSNEKTKDIPYFERLVAFMNDDKNIRAFYDYLMKVDVSDYTHTNRPETEFYKEMKSASMDKILLWILNDEDSFCDNKLKATEWLVKYNSWAEANRERLHNVTSFGLAMNKLINDNIGIEKKTPQNVRYYSIDREKVLEFLEKEELIGEKE
jgi:hypothetical protein